MVVNYHRLAERLVEVADDIDELVTYLWDEEFDDFRGLYLSGDEEATESHIFRSIVKVSNALHDFGDTPEGCISPDPISPQKPSGGEKSPASLLRVPDPEEGP